MSVSDDLTAAQRSLDELTRSLARLELQIGGELEIRRVRHDADHLRESLALLREATAQERTSAGSRRPDLVTIPDAPYNSALWTDAEDEGLGARDRHAP